MAQEARQKGERNHVLGVEPGEHLPCQRAAQHLVEQRVVGDQERCLERLEASYTQLIPGARWHHPDVCLPGAHELDRPLLALGSGSACQELEMDVQRAVG